MRGCRAHAACCCCCWAATSAAWLCSLAATTWGGMPPPSLPTLLPAPVPLSPCPSPPSPQVNRTKWCNRFYPVEHTCYASMDKIEELAAAVVARHFPPDVAEGIEVGSWCLPRCRAPLLRHCCCRCAALRCLRFGGAIKQPGWQGSPPCSPLRPPPAPTIPSPSAPLPGCTSLRCSTTRALRRRWTAWR